LATNQGVVGSIPASRTTNRKARSQDLAFFRSRESSINSEVAAL